MAAFERSFVVRVPIGLVWDFHRDPVGLTKITPKPIRVQIEAYDFPIRKGSRVLLRVLVLGLIAVRWNSQITEYVPLQHFTDEQIKGQGPFKAWKHTHRFAAVSDGTRITDHVEYELPFGLLGRMVERVIGRLLIGAMFTARAQATKAYLERNTQSDAGVSLA